MTLWIRGGRILDPARGVDSTGDLFIRDGRFVSYEGVPTEAAFDRVIDAEGCFCMPGLLDLHVHFRDPGLLHKETLLTGLQSAVRGGFTAVCPMPNTKPAVDSKEIVEDLVKRSREIGLAKLYVVGAVSKGQKGEELSDMRGMKEAGARAVSEDGMSVRDCSVYREGMKLAAELDLLVMAHCEDPDLIKNGGCMNEGVRNKEFGLPGISNAVEDIIVARDILLAKETGARLHLCHCSTEDSVKLLKWGREQGVRVTGEACPHHFCLSEEDMPGPDTNYKMNPPLRLRKDMEAIRQAVSEGSLSAISTDHAPHTAEEKARDFQHAPNGIVGLETCVGLTVTELLDKGYLTPLQMADRMSTTPNRILGTEGGSLAEGAAADLTIIDPAREWTVDPDTFRSKSRNTPFGGRKLKGSVEYTIVDGRIVYDRREEEQHD